MLLLCSKVIILFDHFLQYNYVCFNSIPFNFFKFEIIYRYRQIEKPELRKVDGPDPVMGLYAGCHRTGTVQVGDPVYISAEQ